MGDVVDNNMMAWVLSLLRCITLSVFLDLTRCVPTFIFESPSREVSFARPQAELCPFYFNKLLQCRFESMRLEESFRLVVLLSILLILTVAVIFMAVSSIEQLLNAF